MKILSLLSLLTISFCLSAQDSIVTYYSKNGKIKSIAHTSNGMLNGNYKLFYDNGKTKATGNFLDNQKFGIWKVWDTNDKLLISKEFSSSYQYANLINPEKDQRMIDNISRNDNGLIQYSFVQEQDVLISKRLWRAISINETNDIIFANDLLMSIISKNISDNNLKTYSPKSDQLNCELSFDEATQILSESSFELIGFKIKEDWWYDKKRQLGDVRIICICPVVKSSVDGKISDLFWIYYPELREIIVQESVSVKNSELIENLEDIFHFRHFSSLIYKETGQENDPDSIFSTTKELIQNSNRLEMRILELEIDAWIDQLPE